MIKKKSFSFTYIEYDNAEELESQDLELLKSARKVSENAYAPYSGFKVGAAVRLKSGVIITGTNVENAAFPSGICAERSALSNAASNHPGDFPVALAIAASSDKIFTRNPVAPCGNCRQVIAEAEYRSKNPVRIILAGTDKILIIAKIDDLLPLQFSRDDLQVSSH
jgi:cytidine deaminase